MKLKNDSTHGFLQICFSVILFLTLSSIGYAQPGKDFKDIFKEAESVFLYNKDYEMALPLYLMLRDLEPENANIQYKIGICYLNIPGREKNAIPFLLRASKHTTNNYTYSYKEEHAPVDVFFYLGSANHLLNNLDSAIFYYQFFKHRITDNELYMLDFVEQQIDNCRHAKEMETKPVSYKEKSLGDLINSYHENIFPVVSGDGNILAYTAKSGTNNRIMVSKFSRKKWSAPEDITDQIMAGEDCHTSALSFDGKILIIYKEDEGWADLYSCRLINNRWSEIERVGHNINTKYWEANACLSRDEKTIYFSSNRKGGFGGLDIYKSEIKTGGEWGKPENLGPVINTPLMEDAPNLTADGKRLYFSSQGHYNMGGFDIFFSEKKKGKGWSVPINLGYPINTTDDNLFYCPINEGESGFLSHFPGAKNKSGSEIFRIDFPLKFKARNVNVEGIITLGNGMVALDSSIFVEVRDSSGQKMIKRVKPDITTGKYSLSLIPDSYQFVIKGNELKTKIVYVTIPSNLNSKSLMVTSELEPDQQGVGDVFYLRPVYFDTGKSELSQESKFVLQRLAHIMKEYPSLKFEIIGNADIYSGESTLQGLSAQRAKSVVNYFNWIGIDKTRFQTRDEKKISAVRVSGAGKVTGVNKYERRVDIRLIKSDSTLHFIPEISIPDNLKNNKELTYSILVIKLKQKLPPDYFFRYNMEELTYVRMNEVDGEYLYTLGSFQQKSQAVEVLGKLYSVGFNEARIYDDHEMSEILNKPGGLEKSFAGRTQQLEGPIIYTIQVYALYNPPYKGAFKGLGNVRVTPGKDKFYRYTVGEVEGYPAAYKVMQEIRLKGYKDAFIRPVSDLEKLKKE